MNQPPYQPGPWGPPPPPYGAPTGPGYGPGPGYGAPGYGGPVFGPPQYQPPRKSNAGVIIAIVLVAGVFLLGALAAIGVYAAKQGVNEATSHITADDGKSEIDVPQSWSRHPGLNDKASIQEANTIREQYLIVLTEMKEDFDDKLTLDEYAKRCLDAMKAHDDISGLEISEPTKVDIGGRPGLQYELQGTVDSVKIGYVLTFVEGKKGFHQVMEWTLKSKFSSEKAGFVKVASTFRER